MAQKGRKKESSCDHVKSSIAEQKPPAAIAKKSSQLAISPASDVRMTVRMPSGFQMARW